MAAPTDGNRSPDRTFVSEMLTVETDRPFLTQAQRLALVAAVEAADPADESDWLEWKSTLDLSTKRSHFVIAKAILALANRMPDVAARSVAGHGYLLVGVEPRSVPGIEPLDRAVLEPGVTRFIGQGGPQWQSEYLVHADRHVLLVDVQPPSWGDPIHLTDVEAEEVDPNGRTKTVREATVFVRRQGASHPANVRENRQLQERLLRQPTRRIGAIDVLVSGPPLPTIDLSDGSRARWLDRERDALLSPLRAHQEREAEAAARRRNDPLSALGTLSNISAWSTYPTQQPERRSPEQYEREVEGYVGRCGRLLGRAAAAAFARRGLGRLDLTLHNPSDTNIADVRLVLRLSDVLIAFDDEAEDVELPEAPHRWGPTSIVAAPSFNIPAGLGAVVPVLDIKREGDEVVVAFPAVHLRPQAREPLEPVFVVARPGTVQASWSVTSTESDGVLEGRFEVECGGTPPVPIVEVLGRGYDPERRTRW